MCGAVLQHAVLLSTHLISELLFSNFSQFWLNPAPLLCKASPIAKGRTTASLHRKTNSPGPPLAAVPKCLQVRATALSTAPLTDAALPPAAAAAQGCAVLPPEPFDKAPPSAGGRLQRWPCPPPLLLLRPRRRRRPRPPAGLHHGPLLPLQLLPPDVGPSQLAACRLPAAAARRPGLLWRPAGRCFPGRPAGYHLARLQGRPG